MSIIDTNAPATPTPFATTQDPNPVKSVPPFAQPITEWRGFVAQAWAAWFNQVARVASAVPVIDTHANRANHPAPVNATGVLFESDRNALYVSQTQAGPPPTAAWVFAAGEMVGTLAQRPTDLTANDKSFAFYATDNNYEYHWTGTAWAQGASAVPSILQLGPGGQLGIGSASSSAYLLDVRGSGTIPGSYFHLTDHDADDGAWLLGLHGTGLFLAMGMYSNGTNWIAKETKAVMVELQTSAAAPALLMYANVGLTVGNAFTPTQIFGINSSGQMYLPLLPTANPGAGTKMLWADSTAAYAVKYAF